MDCHARFVKQGQVGVGALLLGLNPTLTLVANSEFGFKCLQSPCSEDGILRVLTRKPQATGSKCTRNEFATSVDFAVNRGNLYPARCCCLLLSNCRVGDKPPGIDLFGIRACPNPLKSGVEYHPVIGCVWGTAEMKSSVLFACGLLALTASVARSQSAAPLQAVEICSVASNPALYDGKEFLVRGLWRMVIHGSILMGTACPKVEVNMTETAGYKSNKKATSIIKSVTRKDQFGSVEVVLRGTFRVAHESQCFGQMCAAYQFETAELLSARTPAP